MGFLQFDVFLALSLFMVSFPNQEKFENLDRNEKKMERRGRSGQGGRTSSVSVWLCIKVKGEDMTSASSEFKSSTIVDVEVRYVFDI